MVGFKNLRMNVPILEFRTDIIIGKSKDEGKHEVPFISNILPARVYLQEKIEEEISPQVINIDESL